MPTFVRDPAVLTAALSAVAALGNLLRAWLEGQGGHRRAVTRALRVHGRATAWEYTSSPADKGDRTGRPDRTSDTDRANKTDRTDHATTTGEQR
ncbi:hypothetical protein [Streptomyces sp. NPDC023327]|uniref:hypothetical protein n=1 Tax=Streptomyces sp. NPDC023327 TaxID=3157088 RepID=UPI0033DAB5AB